MRRMFLLLLVVGSMVCALGAQTEMKLSCAEGSAGAALVPLMKAVYGELGITVTVEMLPAARALQGVNAGSYDGDIARADGTLGGFDDCIFTKELMSSIDLLPWVKKGGSVKIETAADIKNYRVAYVRGLKLAEGYCAKEGIKAEAVADFPTLVKMLENDRFDVALAAVSGNPGLTAIAQSRPIKLASTHFLHVLNKKHADLVPKIDKVLKAMKADGRYEKLIAAK